MSHASGEVRFKDGTIRYVEYNGTSDFMHSLSYETKQEMDDNWRELPEEPKCEHRHIEDVELYSSYGYGFTWEGKCCKDCGWIVEGEDPYQEENELEYLYCCRRDEYDSRIK
ncbi:MAG: hypothetical protein E6356_13990 [Terrisporobacter othiniensis]|nr:hypothetical protein [Terrisporobacter othiniensis]